MGELNCAMTYINIFVSPDTNLSTDDKHIISKAVETIDNWKTLYYHGVLIALTNSTYMAYLKKTNTDLKLKMRLTEMKCI